jgi:hypothetical protein
MNYIFKKFPITNEEYERLESAFDDLCQYQAWQLYKRNSNQSHTDEQEDIVQNLRISLIEAACYYKRQTYIESCLNLCKKYAKDQFSISLVKELIDLWKNKKRHGAGRQKFGPYQENILQKLVNSIVPKKSRPSPNAPLKLDPKFERYCKSISWNRLKAMGRKITKEKGIRSSSVSLSEYDYLATI